MSQASPTIGANKSGLVYRLEDNDGKKALLTHHKGAAAPAYAEGGTIWLDDGATPWMLKVFDGGDWITLGALHAGNNSFMPFMGTSALRMTTYAADSGTANAYDLSPVPAPLQHQSGQIVILKPAYSNTGAATLALGDLDIRAVTLPNGGALDTGDLLAGQIYLLVYDGAQFVVTNPSRSAGVPNGVTIASQSATYTAATTINTSIPLDNTVPQPTEGAEIISIHHTPQTATNRIRVRFDGFATSQLQTAPVVAFLSINGSAAVQVAAAHVPSVGQAVKVSFEYEHIPGSTDEQVYSVRTGPGGASSIRWNGNAGARLFGGAAAARLTVEEIKA